MNTVIDSDKRERSLKTVGTVSYIYDRGDQILVSRIVHDDRGRVWSQRLDEEENERDQSDGQQRGYHLEQTPTSARVVTEDLHDDPLCGKVPIRSSTVEPAAGSSTRTAIAVPLPRCVRPGHSPPLKAATSGFHANWSDT